jgi:hypothetical protein
MGGGAHACSMLRLGRPLGVYPRLEARLAEIRIGGRDVEAAAEEGTGCAECGGEKDKGQDHGDHESDCTSSEGEPDHDTSSSDDDDCGCSEDTSKAWDKSCWNHEFALDY